MSRAPIDAVLSAAVEKVKASGIIRSNIRTGTVSAVNSGGTVDVEIADGEITSVRRLASYASPSAGDWVLICGTAGGWVCLGQLAT